MKSVTYIYRILILFTPPRARCSARKSVTFFIHHCEKVYIEEQQEGERPGCGR